MSNSNELDEAVKRCNKEFKKIVKEEETKTIIRVLKEIFGKK